MKKNFFKSESERLLWVKLNAERIQFSTKLLNNQDTPMGEIGQPYTCMQISLNQLEYDEANCDELRFSFEEFLVLTAKELFNLARYRNAEKIHKMFASCTPPKFNM